MKPGLHLALVVVATGLLIHPLRFLPPGVPLNDRLKRFAKTGGGFLEAYWQAAELDGRLKRYRDDTVS